MSRTHWCPTALIEETDNPQCPPLMVDTSGTVWAYFEVPIHAFTTALMGERVEIGRRLFGALATLGQARQSSIKIDTPLSREAAIGRRVHIVSHAVWKQPEIPHSLLTEEYGAFVTHMVDAAGIVCPLRRLFIGFEVWPQGVTSAAKDVFARVRHRFSSGGASSGVVDVSSYAGDAAKINGILRQYLYSADNAMSLTDPIPVDMETARFLTSWMLPPDNPSAALAVDTSRLAVDGHDTYQFYSTGQIPSLELNPKADAWVAELLAQAESPTVVSIRFTFGDASRARRQVRLARRKAANNTAESAGEAVDRLETSANAQRLREVDDYLATDDTALASRLSVTVAVASQHTGTDMPIGSSLDPFGIPLERRFDPLEALKETLPGGRSYGSSARNTTSLAFIAFSGVTDGSRVGDNPWREGARAPILIAFDPQTALPVWLDPDAAADMNKGGMMAVLGATGSGKTMALQTWTIAIVKSRVPVIVINPKQGDDRSELVRMVDGEVFDMSSAAGAGGFDPFRFVTQTGDQARLSGDLAHAVNMATEIITDTMAATSAVDAGKIRAAIQLGTERGARSVWQALVQGDAPPEVLTTVNSFMSGPLAIVVARENVTPFASRSLLTLVQASRGIGLPATDVARGDLTPDERIALAVNKVVIMGGVRALSARGGGVLMIDEAHHFTGNATAAKWLSVLAREARSLRVPVILFTQSIGDFDRAELAEHIPRWLVLAPNKESDARHWLKVVGFETDEDANRFVPILLSGAARRPTEQDPHGRPPIGVMNDLHGRRAVVSLGPYPPDLVRRLSTNRLDASVAPTGGDPK